jgi:ubiquinone/menaquinone biosynthesis C-methylase UbiE
MKNITHQTPYDTYHGRLKFVTEYVKNDDIGNKKILDIGCGYGWFEVYAEKKGATSIIGTELAESDLVTAKQYIHNPKITFHTGSAIQLPFKDKTFDTVVSWEVLEHIPKETEPTMFSEMARVLKTNGICYLSTPHRSFISVFFDPAYWLIGHRHYRREDIASFATKAHFLINNIRVMGGWWEVISLLDLYISKWIFQRPPFFQDYVSRELDKEYGKPFGFTNIFCRLRKI